MSNNETETKTWNTVAEYFSFEEADKKRNKLLNAHTSVKVKRSGKGGVKYKVKTWDPPEPKKEKKVKNL